MPIPLTLNVFRGDDLLRSEQFNRDIIKIGRLASAHLVLEDDRVSRIHSVIEVGTDGAISIIDMGSAEGTFVNGKKVSRGALRAGDQITLGGIRIVVEGGAAASAVPAGASAASAAAASASAPAPAPANGAAAPATVARPAARAPAGPVPAAAPAPAGPHEPRVHRFPTDSSAPEDLTGETDYGVELRLLWGDTLVEAGAFVKPRSPVLVGDGKDVALRLEGGVDLPKDPFPILKYEDGDYRFAFARGMTGVLDEKGKRHTLGQLVKERKAAADEKIDGAYWIPVPKAGAVRAELGSKLAIEARPRRPSKVKARPWWERINYQFLNLFLILFFVQSAFMVAANNFPYDTDILADDLFKNPSRMAKFIIKPPELRPQPKGGGGEKKDEPGEMAEKHKNEEGKMGKKDAPKTNARSAPKAIDPNAKDVVKRMGLLGALGRGGGGGLSTVFGAGGLGGDLRGAVGNMFGPVVGDSYGLGGLGIRGSGTGGGGQGETIGIGAVGTKGRGGGLGSYGTGVGGLGKKGDRDVNVSAGTATVMGSVDRELIRRVIQEHAAQIRYCYEQQLALNPKLQGKVAITWVIQADGSATSAKVDGATTLQDEKIHRCMMERITSWQFPKPKGGGVAVITYPWILRSSGGE